jgi:hypothetical protein
MCSRHPTTAHGTDSGILGENFRQSVRELAAHCSNSNIVFGAHGSPPTLTGPANVQMKPRRKGQLFDPSKCKNATTRSAAQRSNKQQTNIKQSCSDWLN